MSLRGACPRLKLLQDPRTTACELPTVDHVVPMLIILLDRVAFLYLGNEN